MVLRVQKRSHVLNLLLTASFLATFTRRVRHASLPWNVCFTSLSMVFRIRMTAWREALLAKSHPVIPSLWSWLGSCEGWCAQSQSHARSICYCFSTCAICDSQRNIYRCHFGICPCHEYAFTKCVGGCTELYRLCVNACPCMLRPHAHIHFCTHIYFECTCASFGRCKCTCWWNVCENVLYACICVCVDICAHIEQTIYCLYARATYQECIHVYAVTCVCINMCVHILNKYIAARWHSMIHMCTLHHQTHTHIW